MPPLQNQSPLKRYLDARRDELSHVSVGAALRGRPFVVGLFTKS